MLPKLRLARMVVDEWLAAVEREANVGTGTPELGPRTAAVFDQPAVYLWSVLEGAR